jgi:hypothetical protein
VFVRAHDKFSASTKSAKTIVKRGEASTLKGRNNGTTEMNTDGLVDDRAIFLFTCTPTYHASNQNKKE